MVTLCKLFEVPKENYSIKPRAKRVKKGTFNREVDFFLHQDDNAYKCEVKLMGKGNPESADVVIARDSKVFIADKLSDQNKSQLECLKIEWVELRDEKGYKRFSKVLKALNIPHKKLNEDLDKKLERIIS